MGATETAAAAAAVVAAVAAAVVVAAALGGAWHQEAYRRECNRSYKGSQGGVDLEWDA